MQLNALASRQPQRAVAGEIREPILGQILLRGQRSARNTRAQHELISRFESRAFALLAHLAIVLSNGFAENMTAGRGFIALSVVIFGRWSVRGSVAGTALFGIAAALQYALQAANRGIAFHLLLATPYVVTLLILCGVTGRVRAPEWLGKR